MTISNCKAVAGTTVKSVDMRDDMAAFDALPRSLRRAVSEFGVNLNAQDIASLIPWSGSAEVLRLMREQSSGAQAKYEQFCRAELADMAERWKRGGAPRMTLR